MKKHLLLEKQKMGNKHFSKESAQNKTYAALALLYVFLSIILESSTFSFSSSQSYIWQTSIMAIALLITYKKLNISFSKLNKKDIVLSSAIGVAAIAIWIAIDPLYSYPTMTGYEPTNIFQIAIKLIGLLFVASFFEELLIRRWLHNMLSGKADGEFSWIAFIMTSVIFGIVHHQWLAGIIAGAMLALLLYKTKKIEACILAHLVANAILAIVVLSQSWWTMW